MTQKFLSIYISIYSRKKRPMSTQKPVPNCSQQLYLSQVKPETTKYQSTCKQLNTSWFILIMSYFPAAKSYTWLEHVATWRLLKMFTDLKNKHTLLFFKWITNKNLWYSTGNSAQCYMAAWMGGEFGKEWIHIYVWPSPFPVHKLSWHCLLISYAPIQNTKFFKKNCSLGQKSHTSDTIIS